SGGSDRVQDGRMNAASVTWWRARDHPLNSGFLGDQDGHERRREHRYSASRHIRPNPLHRDLPLPEHYAGKGLNFEVDQPSPLMPGKATDLLLGEGDRALQLI